MFKFKLFNDRKDEEFKKVFIFKTKKLANKKVRELIKDFDLERHAGYIVNYSTGTEIHKWY
jgi:hypothetical protein